MSVRKRISIDALQPGMFVVEMDLPWYRTPFLFHKRLIEDLQTIQVMKQHGIKTVTIDVSRGRDVEAGQEAPAGTVAEAPTSPASATDAAIDAPSPPLIEQAAASPAPMGAESAPAGNARALYAEIHQTIDRIFADLERGVPPTPAEVRTVVGGVLNQVLARRDALILEGAFQRMKSHDRALAAHALDCCILSLVVGIESNIDPALYEHVGVGALLHDIGLVRLPRHLVRARYNCAGQELQLLQQHPHLGHTLLHEQGGFSPEAMRIVLEHHEHLDGSGYPNNLSGEALSPLSQLVGIVNFYDNQVSRFNGRPPMTPHDAVRQLFLAGERQHYTKTLVETVIRTIGVYPVGSLVRLNTGEQAVVTGTNPSQRLKPQVKITSGPQGESYSNPDPIDLSQPNSSGIVRTIQRVLDPVTERVNITMYLDTGTHPA